MKKLHPRNHSISPQIISFLWRRWFASWLLLLRLYSGAGGLSIAGCGWLMESRLADDALCCYRWLGESWTLERCFVLDYVISWLLFFLLLGHSAAVMIWFHWACCGVCSLDMSVSICLASTTFLISSIELRKETRWDSFEQRAGKCHRRLHQSWFPRLLLPWSVLRLLLFLECATSGVSMKAGVLLNEWHPFIISFGLIPDGLACDFLLLWIVA